MLTAPEMMKAPHDEVEALVHAQAQEWARRMLQAQVLLRAERERRVEVVGADGQQRGSVHADVAPRAESDGAPRRCGPSRPVATTRPGARARPSEDDDEPSVETGTPTEAPPITPAPTAATPMPPAEPEPTPAPPGEVAGTE